MPDFSASATCPHCRSDLPPEDCNTPDPIRCRICNHVIWVYAFPALFRPAQEIPPVLPGAAAQGASSCFYHPDKEPACICHTCGRFICSLCDMDFHGEHYCPQCLSTAQQKGKLEGLQHKKIRYDILALRMAVLPVVLILTLWFVPLTAPAALYLSLRYWKQAQEFGRAGKIRMSVALILSILEILAMLVGTFLLIQRFSLN